MRPLSILIICLILSLTCSAKSRYAILVGIGDYPAESGWGKINGDKDITLIQEILIGCDFTPDDISILENEVASRQNILNAIKSIETKANNGDIVVFHFSGHGQLITDTNGDEKEGFDQTIIPYDAMYAYSDKYKGENHIIDDELNILFSNIKSKIGEEGLILVSLDACHSGGGTREEDDDNITYYVRGASERFIIPNASKFQEINANKVNWITISACKWYQSNYEYKVNDDYFGRLSYALNKVYNSKMKASELIDSLKQAYDNMPLSRGIIQSLDIDLPEDMRDKILF